MRKLGLLFIIATSQFACDSKQNQGSITGEIKGLTNDTLYLYSTDGITDRIDTIYAKSGKFDHTLKIDTTTTASLLLNDSIQYPVFMDKGERIEIKGNLAEKFLEVTGNSANDEFTAFQKELRGLGKPSTKALEKKVEAFIREHHSSLVSAYLLEKYFIRKEQPDYRKIKELISRMTGRLLDQPTIEEVSEYIDRWETVTDGKSAPYFNLPNAKGDKISRSSDKLKDKYLLVNFWASYTTDSVAKAQLRKLNRNYGKNKHFAMLGISIDLDKKAWKECIKKDTLSWEQLHDSIGWDSETVKRFAILQLPTNILISPTGSIVTRNIQGDSLSNKIKEVIKLAEEKAKEKKKAKR